MSYIKRDEIINEIRSAVLDLNYKHQDCRKLLVKDSTMESELIDLLNKVNETIALYSEEE